MALNMLNAFYCHVMFLCFQGDRGSFERPWQSEVPPISGIHKQVLPYPSDEETHGMVYVGWRGPKAKVNFLDNNLCHSNTTYSFLWPKTEKAKFFPKIKCVHNCKTNQTTKCPSL